MVSKTVLSMITLAFLMGASTADSEPIYFPGPTTEQQPTVRIRHSGSSKDWSKAQHKHSKPKEAPMDLLSYLRTQNLMKENVPNRIEEFPNSDVQQLPHNPIPNYQQSTTTWFPQSPITPSNAYQQIPYTTFQRSSNIPNAGFQQLPMTPNVGLQQSPYTQFLQSPINPNAGFQQSPINSYAGFQQPSNIPSSGYQQQPYIPYTSYQPIPYTSIQQSSYIPNSLYQQPPNTGFQRSFTNAGIQQNPTLGFQDVSKPADPQILKLDNLIIVVNPPQTQPQPCIPPKPLTPQESTTSEPDDLMNRFGKEEPSKCTWAIVACCSPDSTNVRENCFELLGCSGFFFDNSPCDPKMVEIAAAAALGFYKEANKAKAVATNENRL